MLVPRILQQLCTVVTSVMNLLLVSLPSPISTVYFRISFWWDQLPGKLLLECLSQGLLQGGSQSKNIKEMTRCPGSLQKVPSQ